MNTKIYLTSLLFTLFGLQIALAQKKVVNLLINPTTNEATGLRGSTMQFINSLSSSKILSIDKSVASNLYKGGGSFTMRLQTKTQTLQLDLEEASILSPNFKVIDAEGKTINVEMPRFYKGKIVGYDHSFVTLSVLPSGVEGVVAADNLNYTIGKIKENNTSLHVVYNSNDIPSDKPFECNVVEVSQEEVEKNIEVNDNRGEIAESVLGCRPIEVYFEADYSTYQAHGNSSSAVAAYVGSLFNNVALLYEYEGVNLLFNSLKVWNTTDPYVSGNSTSQVLYLFDNMNFASTGADLAHLISNRSLGGGIAYLYTGGFSSVYGGMSERAVFNSCSRSAAFGVSANMSTTVIPVPTYSWNLMVVAHELGHNFGLPHTHSCNWPGGAIDGCAAVEGSCTRPGNPPGGGTIMSYCHQQSVGINPANGFGLHPGAKMRAEVAAASCLGGAASTMPTAVNASRCDAGPVTISATGCSGTYNWYSSQTGGSSLGSSSSFTTPNISASTTYYVSCTTPENCTSRRVAVNAFIEATAPVPGHASACGTNISLSLTASGCNEGIIEWFDAPTGGTVLGTGNTFSTPLISSTTNYYVHCKRPLCTSTRVTVTAVVTAVCYCPPGNMDCGDSDEITLLRISDGTTNFLNQTSTCQTGGYSNFASINTNLNIGQTYSMTLNNPGVYDSGVMVWIDYDNSGTFSSNEIVFNKASSLWTTHTQTFTIPSSLTGRTIRMRAKLIYLGSDFDACEGTNGSYGEIEDYTITLMSAASPCPDTLALLHPTDSYSSGTHIKKASAASGVINATNRITGTADVTYESKAINLNPGFTSTAGTVFLATPGGCN